VINSRTHIIFSILCVFFSIAGLSQTATLDGIVNSYTEVHEIIDSRTIEVGDTWGFDECDKVLMIQMKGAVIDTSNTPTFGNIISYGNAGNFEFAYINEITGNIVEFTHDLTRSYDIDGWVQLVSVPVYENIIIDDVVWSKGWRNDDEYTGGVVVLEAFDNIHINNNSSIDVTNEGFLQGYHEDDNGSCNESDYFTAEANSRGGQKGESIFLDNHNFLYSRGKYASGGGGGNGDGAGGAGGGNWGTGGNGGNEYEPCGPDENGGIGGTSVSSAINPSDNKIFLGGGGGSGHNTSSGWFGYGGRGGGIVILIADNITGGSNSGINVNGRNGENSYRAGAGGGGAAGAILLYTNSISNIRLFANGGDGGNVTNTQGNNCLGPGGGGGAGVIWSNLSSLGGIIVETLPGEPGHNDCNCDNGTNTNGATAGEPGTVISGLELPGYFDEDGDLAVFDTITVPPDVSTTIYVQDNDLISGDIDVLEGPYYGLVILDGDTSIIYTPLTGYTGYDTIVYENCTNCFCDTAIVIINIGFENNPPVVVDDSICTYPNTTVSYNVANSVFDSDGDNLNITPVNLPTYGSVSVNIYNPDSIMVHYTPFNGFTGWDHYCVSACDPSGSCDTGCIYIAVIPYADAGPDDYTSVPSYFLSGNAASPGTGEWSGSTTSLSFEDIHDPETEVSGLAPGPNELVWTISVLNCSSSDTVIITYIDSIYNNIISADQSICEGEVPAPLTGSLPTGSDGNYTYLWMESADMASWTAASGINNTQNYSPDALSVTTYFRRIVFSGAFEDTSNTVTITFSIPDISFTGLVQGYCHDHVPVVLYGNQAPIGVFSGTGVTDMGNGTGIFDPSSVTPGNTYNVTYTATDSAGCTGSQTQSTEVFTPPSVTITDIPDICISVAPFSLTQGSPSGGEYSGTGITTSPVFDPLAAGTGTHIIAYTYTDGNGCTGSDTSSITVYLSPTVNFMGLIDMYCEDADPVTLTGNHAPEGSFSGPGITDSGDGTASFDPAAAGAGGPYDITYTYTDMNGCGDSETQNTTVSGAPDVSFTELDAGYCIYDDPVVIAGTPAGGSFNGQGITDNGDGTAVFDPGSAGQGGPYIITYSYTDINGCNGSDNQNVTIFAAPEAEISGDTLICEGETTLLTASGGTSFIWNTGDTGQQIQVSPASTTTYTVTVSENGCIDIENITVYVTPIPDIIISGDSTVCEGTSCTLTATAGDTYLWSNGDTGQEIIVYPSTTTTYSVTVTQNGCSGSASFTVDILPAPTVMISGPDSICENEGADITFTFSGSSPWSMTYTDGLYYYTETANSQTLIITVNPSQNTMYTVTLLEDGNGCPATIIPVNYALSVLPAPGADAGQDTEICGNQADLNASLNNGVGMWEFIPGVTFDPGIHEQDVTVHVTEYGTYTFTWIGINASCSDTDHVEVTFWEQPSATDAGEDQHLLFENVTTLDADYPSAGTGVWSISQGSGILQDINDPLTFISEIGTGNNILTWTITNGICMPVYDSVLISVTYLVIPSGFSPNGDNTNDMFVVSGLEYSQTRELTIFNRWGIEVFSDPDYENDWRGINNNGKELPDDTYFYILITDSSQPYTGYIVIKR